MASQADYNRERYDKRMKWRVYRLRPGSNHPEEIAGCSKRSGIGLLDTRGWKHGLSARWILNPFAARSAR